MQIVAKHHPNHLGVRGWLWGGSYKMERYLYLAHRCTGLFLLLFLGSHLIETTFFRIHGQSAWQTITDFYEKPVLEAGLILVLVVMVFHAINGLRLMLLELGFGMGKSQRPIYPYRDSLRRRRGYAYLAIGVIVILAVMFLLNFVVGA
jgi:succinate dehydrogenase / fumarate reductase, cytochrome b subunit